MKTKIQLILCLVVIFHISAMAQNDIDLLIINKQYDKAIEKIERQLDDSPSASLFMKKGFVLKSRQNYQKALNAYRQGLGYEPNNIRILEEIAECNAALGNNFDAIACYEKACMLDSNDLVIAGKLGRTYINLKDYKSAYDVFSGIYAKDSSNVYWNKQLAYCAFRIFKPKQAVHLYENIITANPRDITSINNLVHAYSWKKEGGKVLEVIAKGLEQFPKNNELLLSKAMYMYRTKQYPESVVWFDKYMQEENNPSYVTLMDYGIANYFADDYEKTMEIFGQLKLMNPNDPLVMYYRSLCFKKMNDFVKAEELMKDAIEASVPEYIAEMYHHLGQLYGQQRKFKESIEALKKAHELNPDKNEVLFEIATTYEEYGSNKTMALNFYNLYLSESSEKAQNAIYALKRIDKLKEDLFFDE